MSVGSLFAGSVHPLDDIGFYTLTNERALLRHSNLSRCEMILTTQCNFRCPYCRGAQAFSQDCSGHIEYKVATDVLKDWTDHGLRNVRFSGGEPMLYPHLKDLVRLAKRGGVERIAISTNGSFPFSRYTDLLSAGVNDFSISLDACCSEDADKMAGRRGVFENVTSNIRRLSALTYVTAGTVLTGDRADRVADVVMFAHSLGVSDIRIISAAQYSGVLFGLDKLPEHVLNAHPILRYRVHNLLRGRNVRGLSLADSDRCYLVRDDSAVAGHWHFPCVIYMREGGEPIGRVGPDMTTERYEWSLAHNTHQDGICVGNCLDCLVDYNNMAKLAGDT